jgi:2-polyprenyl-3-methyl-5-hydroxy-6-metoxy-1,4-benzoquinol methylase
LRPSVSRDKLLHNCARIEVTIVSVPRKERSFRAVAEWFEEFFGGFYAKVLPNVFTEEQILEDARAVKRLLGARKGHRVLDIPCGMGRITIPMARMGLRMTGVDLTAPYITQARGLARQEGLEISFIRKDMRRINFNGEFDAAFNWFGSFGYFCDSENLEFCQRVFRALKPGGRFLVETANKSWLLAHFRARDDRTVGGVRIVEHAKWDAQNKRILSTWTLHNAGKTERRRISTQIFSADEMRSLLRAAGFRGIALFGYRPLGRFTRHSVRLVAVCRRPLG